MQILESSALGLRAARHRLVNSLLALSVSLFPMVHVGDPEFFQAVYADAFSHDVVLTEGVQSPVVRYMTASYRWIEGSDLGLVIQPRHPAADTVNAQIVHADLSTEEFHAEWRKVPFQLKAAMYLLVPLIGLKRRFLTSRESLADALSMDDIRSRDEILSWDPKIAALHHCVLHARDARLIETLNPLLERSAHSDRKIAIVYGAEHMRAILGELGRRDFVPVESRWQTAFSLHNPNRAA